MCALEEGGAEQKLDQPVGPLTPLQSAPPTFFNL